MHEHCYFDCIRVFFYNCQAGCTIFDSCSISVSGNSVALFCPIEAYDLCSVNFSSVYVTLVPSIGRG